jgi:hypothetical protein
MLNLTPLELRDGNLVLGIPLKWRLFVLGTGLLLVWIMVVEDAFFLVSGLLGLIAVIGGFYTEKWLFDPTRQLVVHTEGVLFLSRKQLFPLGEVAKVELRNSRPGGHVTGGDSGTEASSGISASSDQVLDQDPPVRSRAHGLSGLFLVFSDGREVNVHTTSTRKTREQIEMGRLISQVCRKPFSARV